MHSLTERHHSCKAWILAVALMVSTVLMSACTTPKNIEGAGQTPGEGYEHFSEEELSAQTTFNELTDEIFYVSVQENMIDLHYVLKDPGAFGITDYVPTLGTISYTEYLEGSQEIRETLEQLQAIPRDSLTREQKLTYDILESYLETQLTAEGMELYTEFLNPTTGLQAQLPILFAEYEFNSERDVQDYLVIINELDDYYAQIIEFQKEKSAGGLFMSDRAVEDIVKGCHSFIQNKEDNYLIEVFNEKIDELTNLDDATRENYKVQNKEAIMNAVIPAYELLTEGLEALKGTGVNEQGICYYEDGQKYYEYLVASKVGTSRSMDELNRMIQSQLTSDLRKMSKSMALNPDVAVVAASYSFPLTDPAEILEDLKVKMVDDYPALPETTYTIKYVHPSLEESLSPAFYLTPPIDDYNRNVIYINNGRSQNETSLYPTLAHEGYPGHLYQNVYFNQVNSSNLRHLLSFTGYSEGWASYIEFDSYYYVDGIDNTLASFLSANASASLAIYAYMDLNINYFGWGIADTKNFLYEYYGIEDDEISEEIFYTMVAGPTSYLKYYVGYLEILDLKSQMQEALGDSFNLRDFHEQILTIGPAPFDVIEKHLNLWVDSQR